MLHYVLEDLIVSMKPTKDIEPFKKIVIIVLMRSVMDPIVTNMNWTDIVMNFHMFTKDLLCIFKLIVRIKLEYGLMAIVIKKFEIALNNYWLTRGK